MKLLNISNQEQQILFINGSSTFVSPAQTVEIDMSLLYEEEAKRIANNFKVVEDSEKKFQRVRNSVEKTEINTGGDS